MNRFEKGGRFFLYLFAWIFGIFFVIGFIAYAIKGMNSSNTAATTNTNDTQIPQAQDAVITPTIDPMQSFRLNFMQTCNKGNNEYEYCDCFEKKLVSQYSVYEIQQMEQQYNAGTMPQAMYDVAAQCIQYYNN